MECDLSKVKKVGFFGGTFDPIHIGHVNLAIQMLEIHELDEVLICPVSQSPHKQEEPPVATKDQRRAMVVAAIGPIPKFTFLDIEIQKTAPCYTIDSIRYLIKMDASKEKEYHLILGEDALENFHLWKDFEELVELAPPLIGTRIQENELSNKQLPKKVATILKEGLTKTSIIEISSTDIRARLKKNLYCGHLLPIKVGEYIKENGLYV
jgi:nicotinate-nucleotide adenylyltransferase